jgi:hypothetical protein
MSPRRDPVDPLIVQKRHLLRLFYVSCAGCAMAFAAAQYLRGYGRDAMLALSLAVSILAVWTLVRFLRVIDEFETLYLYGALQFAFVGLLSLLAAEAFPESFGFPRVPAYANASCAVILWTLGLAVTSWQRHWRRGYEE